MSSAADMKQRLVIGVADLRIGTQPEVELITHALGSCLGITVHDPVAGVGGMLHVMLPQSSIDPEKAANNPEMFVDTGIPRLFKECYRFGAKKERMVLKVAGGAAINTTDESEDFFQIGKRNFVMLRKLLWKNGVLIEAQDVGGSMSRTMSMDVGSGVVTISSKGVRTTLEASCTNNGDR